MGGHGGLNILPQKRWNVYGRENRFKVAQDEEKAAAEQHELERKRRDAESSFRRQKLLADARQRQGAERRRLAASRGDVKTQTSDARFDQQFQFGHGLVGAGASQPWYIQSNVAAAESHGTADLRDWERQAAQALERSHAAAAERIQPRPASPSSGSDSPGRRRSSPLRRTKKSKKSKDRKKDRRKRDKVGRDAAQADLFAALRAERLERESLESQRARDLVLAQTRSNQGYNNTYGYGRRRRA